MVEILPNPLNAGMNRHRLLILVGNKIREARLRKGLTQEELAWRATMSVPYLSDTERGIRNISSVNLMKIAKALEVEVGDFFPSRHAV